MKNVSGRWAALRDVYGGNSVTEIKGRILDYVWGQLRIHGEREPPLIKNPEKSKFVKSRRAKIVYVDMDKTDGHLDVRPEDFLIFVNKNLSERRKRSVIAHELGHTFLFDIENKPIKPYLQLSWSTKERWRSVEGLAWQIGRQILVPKVLLRKYCCSDPCVKLFEKLRKIFNVTTDVMARRLIHDLKLWDVFMFVSEFKESAQRFTIPASKDRFKSRNSFRNFNLNMHWDIIQQTLLENHRTGITEWNLEIGKKCYKIELQPPLGSLWTLSIISPLT